MPDASVPALGRADSTLNGTPTSAHPAKGLSITSSNTQKSGKMAPRVDIETIYTELKRLVGDHWNTYKDAVARYMLGMYEYMNGLSVMHIGCLPAQNKHSHVHTYYSRPCGEEQG